MDICDMGKKILIGSWSVSDEVIDSTSDYMILGGKLLHNLLKSESLIKEMCMLVKDFNISVFYISPPMHNLSIFSAL